MSMHVNNCIIILNYNDCGTTIKLINQVSNYSILDRIIVVDNCSTDNSLLSLSKYKSIKVDVISTSYNYGYAIGNNFGAKYAIEKYNPDIILFANPDVNIPEVTIKEIIETLNSNRSFAMASALVRKGTNVWKLPSYLGLIRSMFLVCHTLEKLYIRICLLKNFKYCEVEVIEGSFFAIKSVVFQKVKGFDERTFLYLEENILAKKISDYGYKNIILTRHYYLHEHSKSIKKEFKSKSNAFKEFRNGYYIYLKYYLKVDNYKIKIFWLFFNFAMLERRMYDFVKNFMKGIKKVI